MITRQKLNSLFLLFSVSIALAALTSSCASTNKGITVKSKEGHIFSIIPEDENQGDTTNRLLIAPKLKHTPQANHHLRIIQLSEGAYLHLDNNQENAFYVVEGEGKLTTPDEQFPLEEGIGGYFHKLRVFFIADSELKVILLTKKPSAALPAKIFVQEVNDIPATALPKHEGIFAQPIVSPQKNQTDFFWTRIRVVKGGQNINYDIHQEQHGLYILKGKLKANLGELGQYLIEEGDTLYIGANLPHILVGQAPETVVIGFKG